MLVHYREYEHASEKSPQTSQKQTYMNHFKTTTNIQIYFVDANLKQNKVMY